MVIKKLEIKRLHGVYNYTVNFNDDLTFLYGENGCGKTTVLDIVSSIVTGRLYNLFAYRFDQIILSYRKLNAQKFDKISIKTVGDTFEVSINNGKAETIRGIKPSKDDYPRIDDDYSYEQHFMLEYEFARYLKKTFKYIYLPLSRNSQDTSDFGDTFYSRRRRAIMFSDKDLVNKNYLNESIRYVEEIVRNGCMRISSAENIINTKFRSNILTSSLKVTREYSLLDLINKKTAKTALVDIDKSKAEYIKILKSIGEWSDESNEQVELFFKKYKDTFVSMDKDDNNESGRLTIDFLVMNIEFNKIKEIAALAQEIEKEKSLARAPKSTFLKVVNDFLSLGEEKKSMFINDEGKIVIEVEHPKRKLTLYNLSSGEKQIIIIFACLTFGLPTNQSGIYIVDEPEASLHLSWQKHFVESIQTINSSIQLIFATHAPEVIGRYSDRAVKLVKKVDSSVKEDCGNEE